MRKIFVPIIIVALALGALYSITSRDVEDVVVVEPGAQESPVYPKEENVAAQTNSQEVIPLEVVEDSRCPVDVQCIQAGTVRVRVRVVGKTTEESVLTLNVPKTVAGKTITLVSVSPEPKAGIPLAFADYNFSFSVK